MVTWCYLWQIPQVSWVQMVSRFWCPIATLETAVRLGPGLLGIGSALLGARRVCLTDLESVVPLLELTLDCDHRSCHDFWDLLGEFLRFYTPTFELNHPSRKWTSIGRSFQEYSHEPALQPVAVEHSSTGRPLRCNGLQLGFGALPFWLI